MRTRTILFSGIMLSFLSGCSRSSEEAGAVMKGEMSFAMADEQQAVADVVMPEARISAGGINPVPPAYQEPVLERKIIRDGDISIETRDIVKKKSLIDTLVAGCKAYLASESFMDNPASFDYNLSVRIPAESFDNFIAALEKGSDRIINKNIRARDVTEEYYDVKTRLGSKKEVEKRYLDVLAKASSVKDILEVEGRLGSIREEIESTEGRLRLLENQVSYSTLNIWLTQPKDQKYIPEERQGFWQQLLQTLHKGWLGLLDFILIFLKLWPVWVTVIILWRVIMIIRKRRKNKPVE